MSEFEAGASQQPDERLLLRMMHMAQVRRDDRIIIADQRHFGLLLGLCRQGFADVACCAGVRGPHASDAPADMLWIPDVDADAALLAALTQFGRDLRPDGLVVIHDLRGFTRDGAERLLGACGFTVEHIEGAYLRARKQCPQARRRAA